MAKKITWSGVCAVVLGTILLACSGSGYATAAEDGLVAHYTFDEGLGSLLRDRSGNGNHGRIHGARFVRSGLSGCHAQAGKGYALRFDGVDDYVNCGHGKDGCLNITDAITLEAWVCPAATRPDEPGIIGKGSGIQWTYGLTFYSDQHCYFYIAGGDNNCKAAVEPDKWTHVAGTFDGATLRLYANGELKYSAPTKHPRISQSEYPFVIGRSNNVKGLGYFQGMIDDVKVYRRALSPDEIRASYKREAPNKAAGGSTIAVDEGLVAYYDFDEGKGIVAGDRSGHKNDAKIENAAFEKAGIGSSLRFNGIDSRAIATKGKGLEKITEKSLSLEAWFKPAVAPTGEAAVVTLSPNKAKRSALNLGSDGKVHFYVAMPINRCSYPIKLGEWNHVVGTFANHVMKLYINGELKIWTSENKITEVHRMSIGSGPEGFFNGLIDEVRAYSRALAADEVFNHYNRGIADMGGKAAPLPTDFTYLLYENSIRARSDFRLFQPMPKGSKLTFKLFRHRSSRPLAEGTLTDLPETGIATWERSREFLPSGLYKLQVALLDNRGKALTTQSKEVVLHDRPGWVRSPEGYSNKVLHPWTPVQLNRKREGLAIGVWGRTYEYGGSAFPIQIESAKQKLLAAPIRVKAVVDGREMTWKGAKPHVTSEKPTAVVFTQESAGTGGKLKLSAKTTIEYDGMVRIDWKIEPTGPVILDQLAFEIPFAPGAARYHTLAKAARDPCKVSFGRAVAAYPGCYICNEDRGLAWFAETDEHWHPADPKEAVEFRRNADRAVLRLHLADTPLQLDPGNLKNPDLSYTFGLIATPIKAIVRDYWDHRITIPPSYGYGYDCLTEKSGNKPVLDHFAELGAKTLSIANWTNILCYNKPVGTSYDLHNLVNECHKRGIKVMVYLGFQVSGIAPEFPLVGKQIVVVPEEVNPDGYAALPERQPMHRVCLKGAWQDWLVHGVARLMDEYDIDGVYLDTTACVRGEGCTNALHGDGYLRPDGTRAPTYPVFATREAMKRLYTVVKTRKPDGLVDMHNTQFPAAAWGTGLWQGEGLAYIPRGPFALDVLPLDRFRAKYMAYQVGLPGEFLVYGRPWKFQEAYAFCMLHDIPIRSLGTSWLVFTSKLWKIFDEFGRKQAEWLPYWRNADYVTVTPQGADDKPGAFVSLYRHDKNGVLAVISNLSPKKHDVAAEFNLQRLGLASKRFTVLDALTEAALSLKDGRLEFRAMPSMDWKLVWIKSGR